MHTFLQVLATIGVALGVPVSIVLGATLGRKLKSKAGAYLLALACLAGGVFISVRFVAPGTFTLSWAIAFWLIWFAGGLLQAIRFNRR